MLKWVFIAFAVIFIFKVSCALRNAITDGEEGHAARPAGTRPPPEQAEPALEVSAAQLFADYDANEVSADGKYKDRILVVNGVVESINKDILGHSFVKIQAGKRYQNVHATIVDSQMSIAGGLAKGQRITVTCKGRGKIVGDPMLAGCEIATN